MRDYGKVYSRFWASADVRALSDRAKLLALYLLTSAHGTLAGICYLPEGYIAEDMKWPSERVTEGFGELLAKGFVTRCELTHWVWITKFLEWNPPQNPNQLKSARRILEQLPEDCDWRPEFIEVFDAVVERFFAAKAQPSRKGSETVSKSVSVSVSGSVTETVTGAVHTEGEPPGLCVPRGDGNHNLNGNGAGHDPPEPEGFATIRAIYPERGGDQRWADALTAYTANLQAGHTHEQMAEGVTRYAAYCKAEGITSSRFVTAVQTFLGPNRLYLQSWKPNQKPKRESRGERWAREEAAKDAAR